ncbi:serine hydrolase domain-containing protein [Mycolicibacterium elephantis]|uniref:Esterase n=1 Tax=Mycolicibacterium elephantis TaxID=81858 RepID=A0A1X0CIW8_9MYCO|nr:serine hydrolase domain-containing protein [Mycolicibacterium elephantis]OBA86224.1 esterase [Mycolicibacterium elephantis]OBF00260.1 esterase [Mycolicibacterium elephantis]ORA59862.1 esterase [Mycolicibacterium elephantis]
MTKASLLRAREGLPRGVLGAADPRFGTVMRLFARMFPGRRFGGGALAVFIDGRPVVDVWTGWSDRRGERLWTADTGAMVFSATKGVTATVIHRLADRGLLDYDEPVATYWPAFAANNKGDITVRDVLRHRAGLSHLPGGLTRDELLDHEVMEAKMAAAAPDYLRGRPAYHALTYGWLLSGLARSVTGHGMRELIREEVARPLNTDGLHLGRPPADAPTKVAEILAPQSSRGNPVFNFVAPRVAGLPLSGAFGAMFFPGIKSLVQGDIPFLDGEVPAANGVVTARALAKMYAAIANRGRIDGTQFLSEELARGLIGKPKPWPDLNIGVPMPFHLGYHESPIPGLLKGFGHIGLGGTLGWADPDTGSAFAFVHNRLLTAMVFDMASFAGLAGPLRNAINAARRAGPTAVPKYGARYRDPVVKRAGRR